MKFSINFRKVVSTKELIEHINRKASFAFSRTQDSIHNASITIRDINGPKGGVDKECLVVIKPCGLKKIVISEQSANLKKAIDRAISRANQSLIKGLKKSQSALKRKNMMVPLPLTNNDFTIDNLA